ncbi:pimeloyl-ACP methyl ester carboxylesterase [Bradyrhizobium niftali]|uniref:alpha/beta hydrolase family protein n=1 Tax=Bradyrhizobium niftali TaxID=2560055 RepID=UPI0038351C75
MAGAAGGAELRRSSDPSLGKFGIQLCSLSHFGSTVPLAEQLGQLVAGVALVEAFAKPSLDGQPCGDRAGADHGSGRPARNRCRRARRRQVVDVERNRLRPRHCRLLRQQIEDPLLQGLRRQAEEFQRIRNRVQRRRDDPTIFDDPTLGSTDVSGSVQAAVIWYGAIEVDDLSIAHYISAAKIIPPILIANGDADTSVPVVEAIRLNDELLKKGAKSTLMILSGAGHKDPAFMATQMLPTFKFLDATFGR